MKLQTKLLSDLMSLSKYLWKLSHLRDWHQDNEWQSLFKPLCFYFSCPSEEVGHPYIYISQMDNSLIFFYTNQKFYFFKILMDCKNFS